MTTKTLIAADSHVVALKISITGITTESAKIRDETTDGKDREVERRVTRHVQIETEAQAATKLAGQLRAAVAKNSQDTVIGRLTSGPRLRAMRDEMQEKLALVKEHNRTAQAHTIETTFIVYPVAPVLDGQAQRELCRQVDEAVADLHRHCQEFDKEALKLWLNRNKALSSLVPWVVGTSIDAAVEAVRESLKRAALAERESIGDPAQVFASGAWGPCIDTVRGMLAPDVAEALLPTPDTGTH